MDDDPGLNPNVAIQLRWLIPTSRIQSIVQAARFACNARFADRFPVDLFSVVLTWPTTDPNLAHLRLLVPTEANRPIADRLLQALPLEITEGSQLVAEAAIVSRSK